MSTSLLTFFLALLSANALAYEFELRNQPHFFIAGDVAGLIDGNGYHWLFDAPTKMPLASSSRPVRLEMNYQSEADRKIALTRSKRSFLVKLKVTMWGEEYHVERFRIPIVEKDETILADPLARLNSFLVDLNTTTPIEDLYKQVTLMHVFFGKQRVLAFGEARIIFDDVLARMPTFTELKLKTNAQFARDIWATFVLSMTEMTQTCASGVAFPPHRKSRIPPEGNAASSN